MKAKDNRRTARKKNLTAVSSSRWAGAMTRASQDQYQLSVRVLFDERACLRRAIRTISCRLSAPCGKRAGTTRGYANQAERYEKQRRLQILTTRLAVVEARIESGRPSIVVGGRRLAKLRHNLAFRGGVEALRQVFQYGQAAGVGLVAQFFFRRSR